MIQLRGKKPWRIRLWLSALVAGVIVSVSALAGSSAFAVITESFHSPLLTPQAGSFAAPITSGTTAEIKIGSLTISKDLFVGDPHTLTIGSPGSAAQFCLNPANTTTTYCIKRWTEVQAGLYLQLFDGRTDVEANVQTGYFSRIQAGQNGSGQPQQFALQGESGDPDADNNTVRDDNHMRAGLAGTASNFSDPNFVGIFGQVPGASGNSGPAEPLAQAALFDGQGTGIGAAGQVAVRIEDADRNSATTNDRRLTVGSPVNPQGICLYGDGQSDGSCVNRWSNEVVKYRDPSSGYLLLQSRVFSPSGTLDESQPMTKQWGVVRVPGHANFSSVVVGAPSGTPSCGDGICTANPESGTCSVDCPGLSGLTFLNVTETSADIAWQTNPETTTSASYGRSSIVFDQQATSATPTALTLAHSIHLSELSSASTYYVRVVGVTASGAALSSTINFSTH